MYVYMCIFNWALSFRVRSSELAGTNAIFAQAHCIRGHFKKPVHTHLIGKGIFINDTLGYGEEYSKSRPPTP